MAVNSLRMRQQLDYTHKVAFVTTCVLLGSQIKVIPALQKSISLSFPE